MSNEQQDSPEALLQELDSIKELLDQPIDITAPVEAQTAGGAPAPLETADDDIPTLEQAVGKPHEPASEANDEPGGEAFEIPVLEQVAYPNTEERDMNNQQDLFQPASNNIDKEMLETLIDLLLERRLPEIREQLKQELLQEIEQQRA